MVIQCAVIASTIVRNSKQASHRLQYVLVYYPLSGVKENETMQVPGPHLQHRNTAGIEKNVHVTERHLLQICFPKHCQCSLESMIRGLKGTFGGVEHLQILHC